MQRIVQANGRRVGQNRAQSAFQNECHYALLALENPQHKRVKIKWTQLD